MKKFCLVGLAAADFHLNVTNETLQVFLPDEMPSLKDLKEVTFSACLRLVQASDMRIKPYSKLTIVDPLKSPFFS